MRLIEVEQGSEEWLKFREGKIGATAASSIIGLNPFKSAFELYKELMGITPRPPPRDCMLRGVELEPKARAKFENDYGIKMPPAVGQCEDKEWCIASFDGISFEENAILEIKCPGQKGIEKAKAGLVPDMYKAQMQHQLYVAEMDLCYYYVFDGEEGTCIEVRRDEKMIKWLVEEEERFYNAMVEMEPLYEWMQ